MINLKEKKKILFVIPSLRGGGAEKIFSILVNHFNQNEFDIHLAVLNKGEIAYPLSISQVYMFQSSKTFFALPKLIKLTRSIRPDFVFSTLSYQNVLIAIASFFFSPVTLVCRESTIPSINNKKSKISWVYNLLIKLTYKQYKTIISQSKDMTDDLIDSFGVSPSKIVLIPNPAMSLSLPTSLKKTINEPVFITVAMFRAEKGLIRLLELLSKCSFSFTYWIIGAGEEEKNIRDFIAKHKKLQTSVKLLGFQKNVSSYLTEADVYLQGSYYEGFPNVLLEAGLQGLPVVAFDCPGGTKDIIEEGLNGFLVNNESSFLEKIDVAIQKTWDKKAIHDYIEKKFSFSSIIQQYEMVFKN